MRAQKKDTDACARDRRDRHVELSSEAHVVRHRRQERYRALTLERVAERDERLHVAARAEGHDEDAAAGERAWAGVSHEQAAGAKSQRKFRARGDTTESSNDYLISDT